LISLRRLSGPASCAVVAVVLAVVEQPPSAKPVAANVAVVKMNSRLCIIISFGINFQKNDKCR
jgi:hypothetical protein